MKKASILFLASVALISATAGFSQSAHDILILPAFSTTAPRQTPAEKAVAESLQELRAQASSDALLANELPTLKPAAESVPLARLATTLRRATLAKS